MTAGGMIIRDAVAEDAPQILRLASVAMASLLAFPVDPERVAGTLRSHIAEHDKLAIVAEVGGHVVGFLLAGIFPNVMGGPPVAEETGWWIDPDFRGNGWRVLLERYEAWGKEKGAVSAMMPASAALPLVGSLLRRAGYTASVTQYLKAL